MAPKNKRARSAKAAPKGAASSVDEAPAEKRRRQLARRDSEQGVDRMIKEWFQDFSEFDVNHKLIDGLCLRDALLQEKRNKKNEGGRISTVFLKTLREKHAPAESIRKQLNWEGEQTCNASVQAGIKRLLDINPSNRVKEPLMSALSALAEMNSRTMITCLRWLADQQVAHSNMAREIGMRMLETIVRLGMHTAHKKDMVICKEIFEELLSAQWAHDHKERMDAQTWWAAWRHLASHSLATWRRRVRRSSK